MELANKATERFKEKLDQRQRRQSPFRVLVVDDEPSILELLQTALDNFEGYEVSIAGSAAAAVSTIDKAAKPFDCILLDIQMPGTNGIELLRALRQMPDYEDAPVIMLTAMCDRKYVDDAFLEGATDYITKPFDFLELRSRMHSAEALMRERMKTRRSMESVRALQDELDFNMQFSFEDPLAFDDVERLLRYVEFDNYIAQLSRGRMFNSQAVAIKLYDASFLYDVSTSSEFRRTISDLAKAIAKSARDKDFMFSYRGSGVFLAVEHGRDPQQEFVGEKRLNQIFNSILGQRGVASTQRALVGEGVSMRSLSKSWAFAALKRAVESADARERQILCKLDEDPGDDLACAPEQRDHMRRRVYEKVLFELFRDETYLGTK
jgi:DNA-binding response OmpR family regulator